MPTRLLDSSHQNSRLTTWLHNATRFLAVQSGATAGTRQLLADGFDAPAPVANGTSTPPPSVPAVSTPPPQSTLGLMVPPLGSWSPAATPVATLPPTTIAPALATPSVPPAPGQPLAPGNAAPPAAGPRAKQPPLDSGVITTGFNGGQIGGASLADPSTCSPVVGTPGSQISGASLQDPKAQPKLWLDSLIYVNPFTPDNAVEFADGDVFDSSAIGQRGLGVCWLLAATLGAMDRGFQPVHRVLGSDDFEFTFYSGLEPVAVRVDGTLPTDASSYAATHRFMFAENAGMIQADENIAVWANLMIKAYAKFADAAPAFKYHAEPGYSGLALGGYSQNAFQALTGRVACENNVGNDLADPAAYTADYDKQMVAHIANLVRPFASNPKTPIVFGMIAQSTFLNRADASGCFITLGNTYCLVNDTTNPQEGLVRITRGGLATYFLIEHEYPMLYFTEVVVQGQPADATVQLRNPWRFNFQSKAGDINQHERDYTKDGKEYYAVNDIAPLIAVTTAAQVP